MNLMFLLGIAGAALLVILLAACIAVDAALPSYHIAITVIKKATVYSLVAVSMNLLNGFTGLFSLGQAGFMLLGAYSYAILTIPVAKRAGVYQYFDGGWIQFSLPEIFSGALGDTVGSVVGMLLGLLVGGILAAIVAYLIGLQLSRFPGACDHWEVCDPRWPGMIAIRLEQLGQYYVPVDGERFLEWLSATPDLTWQHVVNMLAKKRKQLNKQHTRNNG